MWLIAGLGNPGRRYSRTRHNIGFWVLDLFASRQKCPWEERRRFATIGSHVLDDTEILLVKPQAYMNRSGEVVGRILDESGVAVDSVIIVHDDIHKSAYGKVITLAARIGTGKAFGEMAIDNIFCVSGVNKG